MNRVTILAAVIVVLGAGSASVPADEGSEPEYEMTTYQLVLLRKGADWRPMGEREIQGHQEAHLEYLKALLDSDRAIIAGPVDGSEELRGVVVLDVGSVEAATSLMAAGLFVVAMGASPRVAAQTPDRELLRELETRLLAPPDCVPRCAEIAAARVEALGDGINMTLTVHAAEDVAIPLPGSERGWNPQAIALDGSAAAQPLAPRRTRAAARA